MKDCGRIFPSRSAKGLKAESDCAGIQTKRLDERLKSVGIDDAAYGEYLAEFFAAERRQRPYVYDETFAVLDKLKGVYELLLLTNGDPSLQKEKLAGVPELAPYFNEIVISGAFGKGKPDASIFEHCLGLLNLKKKTPLWSEITSILIYWERNGQALRQSG